MKYIDVICVTTTYLVLCTRYQIRHVYCERVMESGILGKPATEESDWVISTTRL
jgi:hypothetical protein